MKLGKKPAKFDSRTLLLAKYLTKDLPPPPVSVDYEKRVKAWPMYGNDTTGDCTCAAAGHMIQEWTANTGREKTPPISAILKVYKHFVDGQTDQGVNMIDVLNYWRKVGFGKDRIHAFTQLELKNNIQVQDAVWLFGGCYLGLDLPDFTVPKGLGDPKVPWIVPPKGPHGDAAPRENNGHCVPVVAYDPRSLWVVTWGILKQMSWQFYITYADEAYAVLSPDWVSTRLKKAPPGLDLETLEKDLSQVTSVLGRQA
jgi:hypothetical protein